MACKICGRGGCCESFHSFEEQDDKITKLANKEMDKYKIAFDQGYKAGKRDALVQDKEE